MINIDYRVLKYEPIYIRKIKEKRFWSLSISFLELSGQTLEQIL